MGRQPLAVGFHDFFSQRNIVGIFRQSEDNFLLIFRNVDGSLLITYLLTAMIGTKLRGMEKQERITYDKKPSRGLPSKGKGPGKGKEKEAKEMAKAKELPAREENTAVEAPVNFDL